MACKSNILYIYCLTVSSITIRKSTLNLQEKGLLLCSLSQLLISDVCQKKQKLKKELKINILYIKWVVSFFQGATSGWSVFSCRNSVGGQFFPRWTENHKTQPPPGINSDQALRCKIIFLLTHRRS